MAIGDPTGVDLASGTTNGNTLPVWNTKEEREISLGAGVVLVSGIKYAIVIRALSGDGTNYVFWYDESYNPYADGKLQRSTNSGSTWTTLTRFGQTLDNWFKTKAGAAEKDSHTFTPNSSNYNIAYGAVWASMSFTASSSYTITSVILNLSRINSPGTITVSIKATEGAPSKATTPAPANATTDVTLDQATITWVDGGGTDTFDVYYGTQSGNLTKVSTAQAGVSFTITGITNGSPYTYLSTRYWRIDSTNAAGTTTGDEWSFTTIRLKPPEPTYWYSAGSYYYRLLIQADGSYGTYPADGGVEDTDYEVLAGYLPNFISTTRRLVGVANSKVWVEDL